MLNPTWASRHGDSNLLYAISQPLSQLPWKSLTFSKIYLEKFFGKKKKLKILFLNFLTSYFFDRFPGIKNFCFAQVVLTIEITFGLYYFLLKQSYLWIDFFATCYVCILQTRLLYTEMSHSWAKDRTKRQDLLEKLVLDLVSKLRNA